MDETRIHDKVTQDDPKKIFGSEMVEVYIQRCPESDYGHGLAYFTTKNGRRIFVWEHGNQWWSFLTAMPADIPLDLAVKIAETHCQTERQWLDSKRTIPFAGAARSERLRATD